MTWHHSRMRCRILGTMCMRCLARQMPIVLLAIPMTVDRRVVAAGTNATTTVTGEVAALETSRLPLTDQADGVAQARESAVRAAVAADLAAIVVVVVATAVTVAVVSAVEIAVAAVASVVTVAAAVALAVEVAVVTVAVVTVAAVVATAAERPRSAPHTFVICWEAVAVVVVCLLAPAATVAALVAVVGDPVSPERRAGVAASRVPSVQGATAIRASRASSVEAVAALLLRSLSKPSQTWQCRRS